MKTVSIAVLCYALIFLGVSPELEAMSIASSASTEATELQADAVSQALAQYTMHMNAAQIRTLLSDQEIMAYAGNPLMAGGYYGSSSNQYSSFFGNMENFLVELVEFFLFLAMLSYVVGYEEWLPWEKKDDED